MLHRPDLSTGLEIVFSTLAGLLLAIFVHRSGPLLGAIMGVATLTAVLAAAWWARARFGYLLDPAYPSLSLTLVYIFSTGFFYFHTARERNEVRWQFSHYLDPTIIEELARRPDKLRLGGENRTVTLYRSDLAGFSRLSEELPPHEFVLLLNEYLTAMTDIVRDHKGFIDKYIGDAIDGVFGAPADDPGHALHAVKAALASRARLQEMNAAELPVLRGHMLNQRIGLHTGVGIVGNIGSSSRRRQKFNYTVIGDSANLASRLEGANKFYGTTILASEATVELAGPAIAWREIDTVRVVGRTGPVCIYEPMGLASEVGEECTSLMKLYAEGLRCWRAQDFAGACRSFECIPEADVPARVFLKRCRQLMQEPPAPGWDHVHALDSK